MVRASTLPVAPTVEASRLRVDRARLRAADPREQQLRSARYEAVRRLRESARAGSQIKSKASLPARQRGWTQQPTGAALLWYTGTKRFLFPSKNNPTQ